MSFFHMNYMHSLRYKVIYNGWIVGWFLFFQAQTGKLFGSQFPCTSAGAKYRSRKNNDHWTEDEMIELVVGVSKRGIGKWSRVKDDYFSTSVRTATHLKVQYYLDYWRQHVPLQSIEIC